MMVEHTVHIPGDTGHTCEHCRPIEYGTVLVSLVVFILLLSVTHVLRRRLNHNKE